MLRAPMQRIYGRPAGATAAPLCAGWMCCARTLDRRSLAPSVHARQRMASCASIAGLCSKRAPPRAAPRLWPVSQRTTYSQRRLSCAAGGAFAIWCSTASPSYEVCNMAHAVACILRSVVGSLLSGLASPRALHVIRGMNLRVRWLGPPSFSWRAARRDSCFLALRGFRHSRACGSAWREPQECS